MPLPDNLPFRIISRTIGSGAYAFIRKACPNDAYTPVVAVKFIHKEHAFKLGRVKPKQIHTEIALHQHVGKHANIVQYLAHSEDAIWAWIAMELAEGGDLFDKIEADEGVGQDIGHFYFTQLVSAVGYMHSRGVAHRDIKPENILLSDGDLKLADFGLAMLFSYNGKTKLSQTVCGSPPYMAPEVLPTEGFSGQKTQPYEGNRADIWSCGIVLFVLLVGNTPWDEPTSESDEFNDYTSNKFMDDELWKRIPQEAISLLKGMLRVDPSQRFTLEDVRRHPWFTRANPHIDPYGRATNPVGLATQMMESLHIDFESVPPVPSQRRKHCQSVVAIMDEDLTRARFALSQPETPLAEQDLDWERPRIAANEGVSASQPVYSSTYGRPAGIAYGRYLADPSLSQFSQMPSVPLSVTQAARRFKDVVPEHSLARFLSFMDFDLLLPLLTEALSRLAIPVPEPSHATLPGFEQKVYVQIRTRDERNCTLSGTVTIEKIEEEVLEVRFLKAKGDPLEWRRLFKKVAILCKTAILRPE